MPKKKEFEHGGARENAGRKAQFNEPTKVIRVPESQVNFIKNWLLNNVKTDNQTDFTSKLKIQQVHPNNDKIYHIPWRQNAWLRVFHRQHKMILNKHST